MHTDPETVITLTVRELVKEQREAFQTGWWLRNGQKRPHDDGSEAHRAAIACYPLPKITRQRVVRDPIEPELRWTIRGGEPRLYDRDRPNCFTPTKERVALWADLLANPNEEVEDDA